MIYQFSENFNSSELVVSEKFPELAKKIVPTTEQMLAAQVLSISVLQPGRDYFGIFDIDSWLRDHELNLAVGGTQNSDHLLGSAADVVPRNFHPEQVFKWYVTESMAPYRQIIYYPNKKFLHISCNHPEKPKKQEAFVSPSKGEYIPFKEYYK